MKTLRNKLVMAILAVFSAVSFVTAATLSYSPTVPQTGDSALVISNKAAVAVTTSATQNTTSATKLTALMAGNSYAYISTATTTVVKATPGVLVRIIVGTVGAGSTLAIYDNATGTTTQIGAMTTAIQGAFEFNVTCAAGITVVSASGTPALITVVYR